MSEKRRRGTFVYAANLVGFAIVIMLAIFLLGRVLGGWLEGALFTSSESSEISSTPEWFSNLYSGVVSALAFLPPYFFLKSAAKPLGLNIVYDKGKFPIIILVPLFLGLVSIVNSMSSMLRGLITAVFSLPPATKVQLPQTAAGLVLYFVVVCVLPAVLEEMLFRGAVQNLLRRWGSRFAILLTSILFSLLHTDLWQLPTIFIISLALGYVAEITGSVRPGIILHFINNLSVFILALAQQKMTGEVAFVFVLWVMFVFVALLAGAVWAVRYFKLGHKMIISKDWPTPKGKPNRLQRLLQAPAFSVGFLALCVDTILRIVR